MVDEALLSWRAGKAGKDSSEVKLSLEARTYPRLRASEQSDFEMYTMGFVVLCLLVSHVLMVTRIVTERERGIVTAMRSMGLLDTAFWLSYVAVALVSSLLTCTLVYLVGLAAGLPLFTGVDGGVLFTIMFVFSLAMAAQAFLVASIVSKVRTAVILASFGLIAGLELVFVGIMLPFAAYMLWEKPFPAFLRVWSELTLPAVSLMKMTADTLGATQPTRELNASTKEYSITRPPILRWASPGSQSFTNYSQNISSVLYNPNIHRDSSYSWYLPPEPVEGLGVLALAMLVMLALAWYCLQLRPSDATGVCCTITCVLLVGMTLFSIESQWGAATLYMSVWAITCLGIALCCFRRSATSGETAQPIYFPLLPRYWLPELRRRRAARALRAPSHNALLERSLKESESEVAIDSDVLDEAHLVCTHSGTAESAARMFASAANWRPRDGKGDASEAGKPPEDGGKQVMMVLIGLKKFFMKEARGKGWWSRCGRCCVVRPRVYAVNGVCLTMRTDEVFALLGHNGAGKTTTINMATAQLRPSSGDALVCGSSVRLDASTVRKAFGCCPQHDILYPELSAVEHLTLFGMLKGRWPSVLARVIPSVMQKLALTKVMEKPVGQYSGGMKRRLSFAIATIGEPNVVMLDEPTTGMDPMNRRFVWDMVHTVKARRTVVLTTHSMEEADALGDRIGIMTKGKLVALGSPLHLKGKFGEGYRLQLVAPRDSVAPIKAKVADLLPAAEILGEESGNLVYTMPSAAVARAPELFRYAEAVTAGGTLRWRNPSC